MHGNYLCMYTEIAADEEWAIIIASDSGEGGGGGRRRGRCAALHILHTILINFENYQ